MARADPAANCNANVHAQYDKNQDRTDAESMTRKVYSSHTKRPFIAFSTDKLCTRSYSDYSKRDHCIVIPIHKHCNSHCGSHIHMHSHQFGNSENSLRISINKFKGLMSDQGRSGLRNGNSSPRVVAPAVRTPRVSQPRCCLGSVARPAGCSLLLEFDFSLDRLRTGAYPTTVEQPMSDIETKNKELGRNSQLFGAGRRGEVMQGQIAGFPCFRKGPFQLCWVVLGHQKHEWSGEVCKTFFKFLRWILAA